MGRVLRNDDHITRLDIVRRAAFNRITATIGGVRAFFINQLSACRDDASALKYIHHLCIFFVQRSGGEGGAVFELRPIWRKRLERLREARKQNGLPAAQLLAIRGVEVLERIGTAEACTLLHTLAQGAPGAWLTRDAHEAWLRLSQRQAKGS